MKVNRENGIEGLIVIGGDGSFRGARDLSLRGIPATIDNVALKNCAIVNYDIFEALNMPKIFDKDTYFLADLISS